jgi:uncharacterized protein YbjQ (UPF0145 family)
MGFLDRLKGGDEDGPDQALLERHQRSLEEIERGGLPLNAQDRLRELAGSPQATFTSTMKVNEFALSHSLGLDPICQVMGSSVYHVGMQFRWTQTGEIPALTQAMNEARRLALGRLYQEAQLAGADAVVGVTITRGEHDFVGDGVEFVAQGTAVRIPSAPTNGHPVLSDLSLQDFWKLRVAGYLPVGVVAASTVYYIVASWATRRAQAGWRASWQNQELVDFTQGVYAARETVLAGMQQQAAYYGAEGVVGVRLEEDAHPVEVGSDNNRRTDLRVTMHVLGTAIRSAPGGRPVTPRPTVSRGAT